MTNPETLHWGLNQIAKRLGVGRNMTREWCKSGIIRAHLSKTSRVWYCTESTIVEDIENIPGRV